MSYCPYCHRSAFEIEEVEISGVKLNFVQCAACQAPVGIMESSEINLTEVLRVLILSLQKVNSRLERIEQAIGK